MTGRGTQGLTEMLIRNRLLTAIPSGFAPSASGFTASTRRSRRRAAARAARPGLAAKPPPVRFASASAAGRSSAPSATATATGVSSRCAASPAPT